MTIVRWAGFSLGAAVLLAFLGIALATILARVNQSAADTLTLRSSVLQATGDQLGLWNDQAKTNPVTSLSFKHLRIQPPLRSIGPELPQATIFVENLTTGDLYLVQPCGPVESPPGTVIGTMDATVHILAGDLLGNTCDVPNMVVIASGDLVRAELGIELAPGLASGDYAFQTRFEAVSQVAVPPPAGMVSWWPGDGNARDIIDGNPGTLSGDATFTPGMVGQAFSLDGTGDFVVVPDSPNINIIGDVTVDLWAKRTVFGGSDRLMVAKGAGAIGIADAPSQYELNFDSTDHLTGGFERADGSNVILIGPTVTDTNFHHYAYVRSGDTHRLFMDGIVVTEETFTGSPGDTSGIELALGALRHDAFPGGFCCYFGGIIDEVEVFNRALTAAEIRAIYSAGSAGKIKPEPIPPPAGMVSWWPGDGNANDIVGDNQGALQGGATYAPGMVDQAFSLDGVDDFVEAPQVTNLDGPSFTGLTIDAWIRPDTVAAYLQIANGTLNFSASWDPNWVVDFFAATSSFDIRGGRWTHVAGTWSGGSNVKLYIDGVEDTGATVTAPNVLPSLGETSVPINIGALTNISNELTSFFDGLIDEVEIFNRALTSEEIRAIYDAGSAGKTKP